MWQPNRAQWSIIWTVAVLIVLVWPPDGGYSLGVKLVRWGVDPTHSLPDMPAALPMGLEDNGDAVAAHDADAQEYYRVYNSSAVSRRRMEWKETDEPFERSTARQLLVGLAVLSALALWRLNTPRSSSQP